MKREASNASYMKQHNKQLILRLIRKESISRAEIARKTGLTRAAVSIIVDGLAEEKLVMETGTVKADYGRKPVVLEINPDAYYTIGLNISRSQYSLGLVNMSGHIIWDEIFPMPHQYDAHEILRHIIEQIHEMIKEYAVSNEKILGLGITAPGPLDVHKGIILDPPNFELWKGIPIVSYLKESFPFEILLENNSRALAQAENSYGIGNQIKSFLLLVVDTGIGGGIVINNALYRGVSGFGSEIGHTSISIDGKQCDCGNEGCLEVYASIPAILKEADCDGLDGSWEQIVDKALNGDDRCMGIIEKEADYLSAGIVNALNILELEAVVLAGDVNYRSDLLRAKIERKINSRIITRHYSHVNVVDSAMLKKPEIISAANLVIDRFFEG